MALTERSSRIEEASRGSEQIAALFASIGKQEQIRRERQQLDSIAQLVSRTREEGRDATTQEILSVLDQPAEIGTGLQGFFQKLGGRLQPEPGRIGTEIRGGIVSSALKRAMAPEQLLTPEEQAQARRVKARIAPPAKAGIVTQPFEQTKEERGRNRDTKTLLNEKASKLQKKSAKRRLRANPALQAVTPGQIDYAKVLKGKSKEKVKGATLDRAFGKQAYTAALQEAKDLGLTQGFTEASTEEDFNRWWDEQASSEDPKGFGKLVLPRSEFQEGVEPPLLDQDTAASILEEAGGDKEKARVLAKERGFKL